jgi:hypothetical protein
VVEVDHGVPVISCAELLVDLIGDH